MTLSLPSRTVADSKTRMTEIVLPEDTNYRGSIFGGRVLALVDKCAAVVAIRHARSDVLTVSLDSVTFRNPVRVGQILILRGWINAAFRTSMEIEVEVLAEQPTTGETCSTTRAFVTMVAIDEEGRPREVPKLAASGEEESRREREAKARRSRRIEQRD